MSPVGLGGTASQRSIRIVCLLVPLTSHRSGYCAHYAKAENLTPILRTSKRPCGCRGVLLSEGSALILFILIAFFCFSTIQLIAFALSQKAIKTSDSSIFSFISTNYSSLNIFLISILLISALGIYAGFFIYSNKNRQYLTKYLTLLLLITTLIWAISQYSIFFKRRTPLKIYTRCILL